MELRTPTGTVIDAQGDASGNLKVTIATPSVVSAALTDVQTSGTGASWVAFPAAACTALDIYNDSGTDIEFCYSADTTKKVKIANGGGHRVVGITNANQVSVRRVDVSNVQVTIVATKES